MKKWVVAVLLALAVASMITGVVSAAGKADLVNGLVP